MNTISNKNSLVLMIDVQEKLVKMLGESDVSINAERIVKAAEILNIPLIITEQYPKGLGSTLDSIKNSLSGAKYVEKTNFSALKEEGFEDIVKSFDKKQVILFGIEAHICVLQTAFDLINKGYEVFVVENASGSRCEDNKQAALKRLMHSGVQIVTTEMVLFELLEGSKHPNFKEVQALIK
jgi:nicotinamidase-related amidase